MTATIEVLCLGVEPSGLGMGKGPRLPKLRFDFTLAMDRPSVSRAFGQPRKWDLILCESSTFYDLGVDRALAKAGAAVAASLIILCPLSSALSPAEASRRGAADRVMHGDREHLEMVMAREIANAAARKELAGVRDSGALSGSGAVTPVRISDYRSRTRSGQRASDEVSGGEVGRPTSKPDPAQSLDEPARAGARLDDRRIKQLIDAGGLTLEYQPIAPLRHDGNRQGAKFEALLRLRNEDGELLLPGTFYPAAARPRWLGRFDLWVFRRAL
ncbi:MAG: EAL domain-containing protein, partial [Thiohalocapsa sp.]